MLWLSFPAMALLLALLLELLCGEPRRYHPLVGFGRVATALEGRFNRGSMGIVVGALSYLALLAIPVGLFLLLQHLLASWAWLLDAWALWFALGAKSLFSHVRAIAAPLMLGDLPQARRALSFIVSRDCTALDEEGVAKGAIESTLENGADAIFASLFWFAVFGGVGVLIHRFTNTLDAMWGYRTPRFNHFGRCAARCDDLLNYIPARLTSLSYALLGQTACALRAWREQAGLHDSPNAGPVMAAGAGSLGLTLGGAAVYHGRIEPRPALGYGPAPGAADIERGLILVKTTMMVWIVSVLGVLL